MTVLPDPLEDMSLDALDYNDSKFDKLLLHDLFINQVKKTPNSIALVDPYGGETNEPNGKSEWTYTELDILTNQLACVLIQDFSVQPDSVVGILLPRSALYVISYIAILKAGGAYMPLELVYPKQLLEQAIDQTEAKCVITTPTFAKRVSNKPHLGKWNSVYDLQNYFRNEILRNGENSIYGNVMKQNELIHSNRPPSSNCLAFVVMSSGTTGKPKGICQVHRSAVHAYTDRLLRYPYHRNTADADTGDVVIEDRVGAGVFFVWECIRPVCGGGTIVIIPDHVLFDPPAVTEFCATHNITRLLVTPSLLQLILDTMEEDVLQKQWFNLRYLWLCGEVVSIPLAKTFIRLLPHVKCRNLYSISECHDVSIGDLNLEVSLAEQAKASASSEEEKKKESSSGNTDSTNSTKYATCGYACPGVQMYIVDLEKTQEHDTAAEDDGGKPKELPLVPTGETGEVYVGGPGIGRGYLHMPEKTKERFVPNPFDTTGRYPLLYRTGDLGRLSYDDDDEKVSHGPQLEILGRCDFMVKLRGYSVVLGAIETALSKHSQLSSAVVMAVGQEGSMDKILVAYVVPKQWDNPPSAASVRSFLKHHVPPYAIPSTFCVLDALPVHASSAGKVDRKQLPPVEKAKRLRAFSMDDTENGEIADDKKDQPEENIEDAIPSSNQAQRLAPQTSTEKVVVEVWAELLELPAKDFSAVDSFFEVGGHSLLATRMVSQLNQNFADKTKDGEKVLSIAEIVQGPTIREVAAAIDEKLGIEHNDGSRLAPKTSTEKTVVEVWAELLELPAKDFSAVDSFFEVGGHSLLATRMVSQLNQRLGSESGDDGPTKVISIADIVQGPTIREVAAAIDDALGLEHSIEEQKQQQKIDLLAEAEALDPSIYPFATRKGKGMSRFRVEGSTLLPPKVMFLTGATGYLGVHILAEMLLHHEDVTVVCLVRAKDDLMAKNRVLDTLQQYGLLEALQQHQEKRTKTESDHDDDDYDWEGRLIGVAGDLSQPLLGMDIGTFKSLALELDSIIHCGAWVNLVQPYQALKASNVLGTQEVLRLATTNGIATTKVKPVHYISTNGIFSVNPRAYNNDGSIHYCLEDTELTDATISNEFLTEGYGMSKWVAEQMCTIAESRGLPVSVMRPGNMGPCSYTTNLNEDDFAVLLIRGMIALQCAPDAEVDADGNPTTSSYAVDWTPVDFAAQAAVQLAVHAPTQAVGQRMHLQTSRDPLKLSTICSWLRESGHVLESVSRDEWISRLQRAAAKERDTIAGASSTVLQRLESGWDAFEPYFKASAWLRYGNKNLENALKGSGGREVPDCSPRMDQALFAKWFPVPADEERALSSSPTTVMASSNPAADVMISALS